MPSGYSTTNFPNGITSFGVPVIGSGAPGIPMTNANGNYWFVSSTLGNNGNPGSFPSPFATLAYALQNPNLATNDTIVVMEGHKENITAAGTTTTGILAAISAAAIVGLGSGVGTPTFTFTTATTATFKITGAATTLTNLKFVCGINSQVTMLDIQAKGVVVQACTFQDDGTHTGLSFIDLVNASANASDGLKIQGNFFYNPTAGNMNHAVGLTTVQDNIQVGGLPGQGNQIYGNFALSGIHNITGTVMTNLTIGNNYVKNLTAAKVALNFISASTGVAYNNVFEPGDSTVNSAKFGTALDASGKNSGWNGLLDAGAEFWYAKKGVVCSTITTAGVAVSAASIGGELAIKNVITKTDPTTGLAGFTGYSLKTNNVNGSAIVATTTGVSAATTTSMVPLSSAGVTPAAATVLESGKQLLLAGTTTAGTGAGTVDVYVLLQRLTAGADLSQV